MHRFGRVLKNPNTLIKKKKKKKKQQKKPKQKYAADRKGEPRKRTIEKELRSVIDGGERKF